MHYTHTHIHIPSLLYLIFFESNHHIGCVASNTHSFHATMKIRWRVTGQGSRDGMVGNGMMLSPLNGEMYKVGLQIFLVITN